MKIFLRTLLICLPLLPAAILRGQAVGPSDFLPNAPPQQGDKNIAIKYALILPDDKTAEAVKAGERNPFGKNENELNQSANKGTTQENMIREHLSKLHVSGFSPGPNGIRVMLGDMALEEGQTVPVIIPDQTLNLKVSKITRQAITLVWIEKKNSTLPARLLTLPVDLDPSVRYVLHGRIPADKTVAKGKTKAVENTVAMGVQAFSTITSNPANPDTRKNATPEKQVVTAPADGTTPQAITPPAPSESKADQPAEWDRAVWMLKNLAKLEEAQN